MAIRKFFNLILQDKGITIFGDGEQLRDFTYISDIINGLILSAESKKSAGDVFNLGVSSPISVNNLVDKMYNLIDGILQYSRVGRIEEDKKVVDLNQVIKELVDMLHPPENIEIKIDKELPVIKCEETRIRQVLQNLISNAIKYMDKPKGEIKVGCISENDCWKFYVSDNGRGIEEKYRERIFQIFQTLQPKDENESVGAGLSVVQKIVEVYGGKIWLDSTVGEGTTFFFTLPKEGIKSEQNL